jgi:hypothetical protein
LFIWDVEGLTLLISIAVFSSLDILNFTSSLRIIILTVFEPRSRIFNKKYYWLVSVQQNLKKAVTQYLFQGVQKINLTFTLKLQWNLISTIMNLLNKMLTNHS